MSDSRVHDQIHTWAKDLIDLSKRNNSLFFKALKRGTLELVDPAPSPLFSAVMEGNRLRIFVPPALAETPDTSEASIEPIRPSLPPGTVATERTDPKDLVLTLRTLHRQAGQDLMDRGVQTLYVCFGMLRWYESADADKSVRSPLVFVPVELERTAASDEFRIRRSDEDVVLNPSLHVLMSEQFDLSLDQVDLNLQVADDLMGVLDVVAQLVSGQPRWSVEPTVVLKRATFHKEAMYRDLLDNTDLIAEHALVQTMAGITVEDAPWSEVSIPDQDEIDTVAPPEEANLILDADSSQRRAIAAALAGASFVMDGPPGTGKSQTIANMLAELIAAGKNVLFVSEKAAALEVVANRLEGRGLKDFVLELHSHTASRKAVVQELAASLKHHPESHVRLTASDRSRARRARESLTSYAEEVNQTREPLQRSILDGQQRLTSLFQSLRSQSAVKTRDDRKRDTLRWYYLDIEKSLQPDVDMIDAVVSLPEGRQIRTNFGRDVVADYSTSAAEYDAALFPLTEIFDPAEWRTGFEEHHDYDRVRIKQWNEFEREIVGNFSQYQLPVITLTKETSREAVCLVFEKVNTGGIPLDVFELLTATFAAEEKGFNLREDWEARRRRLIEATNQPAKKSVLGIVEATDFLQALSLLVTHRRRAEKSATASGRDLPAVSCKKRDVLKLSKRDLDDFGEALTDGFVRAARFLNGESVFEQRFVPYKTQLVPLAALMTLIGQRLEDAGPRDQLRRWYWCGVFGELYGSSTETRFANDLLDMLGWIDDPAGRLPRTVQESNLAPERLESLRTRGSAAYRGLYVMLLRADARDWRTGEASGLQTYYDEAIDIHHVFPRKWCRDQDIEDDRCNSIINKAPLTARTNRIIGGDAPSEYLPALESKIDAESSRVDPWLASHLIDPASLRSDDFETFYRLRRDALLECVAEATGKQQQTELDDAPGASSDAQPAT